MPLPYKSLFFSCRGRVCFTRAQLSPCGTDRCRARECEIVLWNSSLSGLRSTSWTFWSSARARDARTCCHLYSGCASDRRRHAHTRCSLCNTSSSDRARGACTYDGVHRTSTTSDLFFAQSAVTSSIRHGHYRFGDAGMLYRNRLEELMNMLDSCIELPPSAVQVESIEKETLRGLR